ncbi:MAG: peptidylprolyl isomerase [Saprospiraceae bacterium]|nr:peptidylprolyl isomerase [Saprospiraceae bacterium]
MALIGKIRNNFWFVLLVLGLALAAFVIMDMVNAGNQGGMGPKQIIGEIAGSEINYQDFQKTEQALFSGSTDSYAGKNGAWNYLIEKGIVDKQAEDLGVSVSIDELKDLQFGTNLSPVIQQVYRNPQTGQIDMQNLLGVKQALEAGTELNPDFAMKWEYLQKQIIKTAKQDKINALVSKSIYTPNFFAENTGLRTSQKASFDFVKIPFDFIEDGDVEVTDEAIKAYLTENAFQYTNDVETRVMEYASFEVVATTEDSTDISSELANIAEKFESRNGTTEDSLFTVSNEGFYSPFFSKADDLTGDLKEGVTQMEVGEVFGPYLDNGAYFIAKLTDKKVIPDSVDASHILRTATPGNATEFAAARAYIDSLRNEFESGNAKFADLATNNSQDPGSAARGGELDRFTQGKMVPEFNDACFVYGKEGGLYTVQTQYGIHLIKVGKQIFDSRDPKYKLAIIRSAIVPSATTQNMVYDKVDEVISSNSTFDAVKKAVEGMANVTIEKTSPLKMNDYQLGALGSGESSREAIKWAFDNDTEVGEVSPVIYEYSDPINYYDNKYVLVGLAKINDAGLAAVEDVRDDVEILVMNKLKGDKIASQVSGSDLNSIASAFNATVESATDVAFTASSVTGLGNEPEVLSNAFSMAEGSVSSPIVGNNGVYVVKTNTKVEGTVPANVIAQKRSISSSNRGRVGFSLMNALKEQFKPTDNRYTYF